MSGVMPDAAATGPGSGAVGSVTHRGARVTPDAEPTRTAAEPGVEVLERVMATHWQAPDRELLGDWLLRAAGGFTGRANSVLTVGEPGLALPDAIAAVTAWYAERGLIARASVAGPAGPPLPRVSAHARRGAAFAAAGWRLLEGAGALVLTAALTPSQSCGPQSCGPQAPPDLLLPDPLLPDLLLPDPLLPDLLLPDLLLPDPLLLDLAPEPDEGWLTRYRYRGQDLPAHARDLLLSAPDQVFCSIRDGARTVAVARGSLGGGWTGITAVEVEPQFRRRGLASVLLAAITRWGTQAGATSAYLQVGDGNDGALALYRRAGFTEHHRYDYLTAP